MANGNDRAPEDNIDWTREVREWGEQSWSPITGCDPTTLGCVHCWARELAYQKAGTNGYPAEDPFQIIVHDGHNEHLNLQSNTDRFHRRNSPAGRRIPTRYFVCVMGDIFHHEVPFEAVQRVFELLLAEDHHVYLVCTKQTDRMVEIAPDLPWERHMCLAVSLEADQYRNRVEQLRNTPAQTKILFVEPLLGPLPNLDLTDINQVVVGGESGDNARPMDPDWARDIRDQCLESNVPFYFKQHGAVRRRRTGSVLDGEVWGQWPEWINAWHEARGYVIHPRKAERMKQLAE